MTFDELFSEHNLTADAVGSLIDRYDISEQTLLRRAANASGFVVESWLRGGAWVYRHGAVPNADGELPLLRWCPLDDSADAFSLALLLRIAVCRDEDMLRVGALWETCGPNDDYEAIARRLIVRAAAIQWLRERSEHESEALVRSGERG